MTTYKSVKYNISGADLTGLTAGQIPNLDTAKITTGTMADARIAASNVTQHATSFDDNKLQSNIALLGFKTAVNGSLAKYNLVDQIIDEFEDASGVDTSASTNETLTEGTYFGGTLGYPTGGTITTPISGYRQHAFTANGSLEVTVTGNVGIMVVAGGASGGSDMAGGGGAGGLVYKATHELTSNTYDAVIGAGGAGQPLANTSGNVGIDTTFTINGGAVEFTAKGGGTGGGENIAGGSGGSGGGASYSGTGGSTTQAGTTTGVNSTADVNIGYAGGVGRAAPDYNGGGGGGAGGIGAAGASAQAGAGGLGYNASAIFGTAVGDSGWFASGGGGGWTTNSPGRARGSASIGGGRAGANNDADGEAGQANTGGGSGGGGQQSGYEQSGVGGSGVVVVRYAV